MQYIVMCRVSGGVTGTRTAELKKDGKVQYFETQEAAQERARQLNEQMNTRYSVANFQYWSEAR